MFKAKIIDHCSKKKNERDLNDDVEANLETVDFFRHSGAFDRCVVSHDYLERPQIDTDETRIFEGATKLIVFICVSSVFIRG